MEKGLVDKEFIKFLKLENNMPSLCSILDTALKMNIEIKFSKFMDGKYIFSLKKDNKEMLISRGNAYSSMRSYGEFIALDKLRTFEVLNDEKINTPKTFLLSDINGRITGKYVVKPRFGSKGEGVNICNLNIGDIVDDKNNNIVQEFVLGYDLRMQAVGGEFFAACVRDPANVVGDGVSSIEKLILKKNLSKLRLNRIVTDSNLESFISNLGFNLGSVLEKGVKVYLRELSNVSLGGDVNDVTEEVHSSYLSLIKKISEIYKERNFAVDLMVTDHKKSFEDNGSIIEINIPCMWYHHLIAEPKGRDVGRAILEDWLMNSQYY